VLRAQQEVDLLELIMSQDPAAVKKTRRRSRQVVAVSDTEKFPYSDVFTTTSAPFTAWWDEFLHYLAILNPTEVRGSTRVWSAFHRTYSDRCVDDRVHPCVVHTLC
jgi:hypothetical protein